MDSVELHKTTDASVWAKEFVRMHGGDEGLMLAWFANAMVTAGDHEARKKDAVIQELVGAIDCTREYVGPETLPNKKGWSWFDAMNMGLESLGRPLLEEAN